MMQKVIRTCKSRTFGMRAIAFLLAFLMVISPLTAFAADMDPDISDLPTSGEDIGDEVEQDVTSATYTVRWLDSDENELASETREDVVGASVMVNPDDLLAMEGYVFRNEDERNLQTEVLAADGSTELKLYFDKVEDESEVVEEDDTTIDETVDNTSDVADDDATVEDKSEIIEADESEVMYTVEWRNSFNQLIQSETRTAETGSDVSVTEDDKSFDKTGRYFFNEEADNVLQGVAANDLVLVLFFDDANAVMPASVGGNTFHFMIDMRPYGGKLYDNVRTDIYPSAQFMSMYDKFNWAAVDNIWNYQFSHYWSDWGDSPAGATTPGYGTFYSRNKTSQTGCEWYFGYPKLDGIDERVIKWMPAFVEDSVQPKNGFRVDAVFTGDVDKTVKGSVKVFTPGSAQTVDLNSALPSISDVLNDGRYNVTFTGWTIVSGDGTLTDDTYVYTDGYHVVQANYTVESRCSFTVVSRIWRDGVIAREVVGDKISVNPDKNITYDLYRYNTKFRDDSKYQFDKYVLSDNSASAVLSFPSYISCKLSDLQGDVVVYADWVYVPSISWSHVVLDYNFTGDVTGFYSKEEYQRYPASSYEVSAALTNKDLESISWFDLSHMDVTYGDIRLLSGMADIFGHHIAPLSSEVHIEVDVHVKKCDDSDDSGYMKFNIFLDETDFCVDYLPVSRGDVLDIGAKINEYLTRIQEKYPMASFDSVSTRSLCGVDSWSFDNGSQWSQSQNLSLTVPSDGRLLNGIVIYFKSGMPKDNIKVWYYTYGTLPNGEVIDNWYYPDIRYKAGSVISLKEHMGFDYDFDMLKYNFSFVKYSIQQNVGNHTVSISDPNDINSTLSIVGIGTKPYEVLKVRADYTATYRSTLKVNTVVTGDYEDSYTNNVGALRVGEIVQLSAKENKTFFKSGHKYTFEGYEIDSSCDVADAADAINDGYYTAVDGDIIINAKYSCVKLSSVRVDVNVTGDFECYNTGTVQSGFNINEVSDINLCDYISFDERTFYDYVFDGYTLVSGDGTISDVNDEQAIYHFVGSGDKVHVIANFTVTERDDVYYLYYDTSGYEFAATDVDIMPSTSVDGNFIVTRVIPNPGNNAVFVDWEDADGNVYKKGDSYHSDEKVSYLTASYKLTRGNYFYYKCGSRLRFDDRTDIAALGNVWKSGFIGKLSSSSGWNTYGPVVLDNVMPAYDDSLFDEYSDLYVFDEVPGYYIDSYDFKENYTHRRLVVTSVSGGDSYHVTQSGQGDFAFDINSSVYSFIYNSYGSEGISSTIDSAPYGVFVKDYNAIPFANKVDIETKISGDLNQTYTVSDEIMRFDTRYSLFDYVSQEFESGYDYRFLGYSMKTGEGTLIAGDSLKSAEFSPITKPYEGKIVVQALFEAIEKPCLTYDTKGGSEVPNTYAENDQFMVTRRVPVKEDYVFKGWSKSEDALDVDYIGGDYLAGTTSRTLYAVWVEDDGSGSVMPGPGDGSGTTTPTVKTYTLTYDTKTDVQIDAQKSNTGSFTVTRRTPVKTGYVFAGWSLSDDPKDASEVDYFSGDVFPATKNVTLYAVYVPETIADNYSVTYDTQGGSEVKPTTPIDGQFMVTRQVPVKKGYTFAGWALESDSKGIDYIGGDRIAAIEDVTLYAIWVKDTVAAKYTLSYDTQGGSEVLNTEAIDGKFMVTRRTPKKDGKVFLGWSLYPDDDDIDYIAGDIVLADKNVTLYAVYTDAADAPITKTYTITYDVRGGSAVAETKSYNGIFTVTRRMPEKEGLTFVGWTLDPDSENPNDVDYAGGDTFPAEEDLTLYALWVKAAPPIHVNGGSEVETTVTVENNQYIIVITIPTKPGYTFPGWDTDGDGTPDVEPGDPIVTDDLDTPIDAVWELKVTPAQYVTTNDSTWLSNVLWDSMDTVESDHVRGVEDALIDSDGRAMVQIPDSVPVRTGYVFVGWELSNPMLRVMARSNAYYQAGDAVYMDEIDSAYENGLRFTAIWEPEDSDDGNTPGTGDKPDTDDGNTPGTGDKPDTDDGNTPGTGDKPGTDDGNTPGTGDKPGTDDGNTPGTGDKPGTDDGNTPGTGDKPGTDDGNTPGTGDKPGTDDGNTPGIGDKPTLTKPSHMQPTLNLNYGKPNRTPGMVYRNSGRTSIAPKTGDTTNAVKTTTAALALLGSLVILSVTLERKKRSIQ